MAAEVSSKNGRALDAVIFGATGFTGKRVAKELLRILRVEGQEWRVGIAGRSRARLVDVLEWLQAKEEELPIVIADVDDMKSLAAMCNMAKVVLNCVGPYRLYGRKVVAACVAEGTDYVDVSGEPEFMERMEMEFGHAAEKNNSLVISSCGFDSVPADLGVIFATKAFQPPVVASSVESFLTVHADPRVGMKGHFGTWESLVLGLGHSNDLRRLRAQESAKLRQHRPAIPGPPLLKREGPFWEPRVGGGGGAWALKFQGADAAVVRRSTYALARHQGSGDKGRAEAAAAEGETFRYQPVHYAAFFTLPSLWQVLLYYIFGSGLVLLSRFSWGQKLLLKYPAFFSAGIFSHEGPTQEQLDKTSFEMLFIARGYSDAAPLPPSPSPSQGAAPPDMTILAKVAGPEAGYVATPIIMVQCCLCLLRLRLGQGRGHLLRNGGVVTPAVAFAATDLQQQLHRNGVTFTHLAAQGSSA